jgi:cobalt-zinc-cadmium efflux system membrane fusion protein
VQERFGIVTEPAGPGRVEVVRDLPGEIVSDPDRMVHVKPPFAGTVQRVFEHLGDRVEAGAPLAVIESARSLAPYTVKAGIPGIITAEHAAPGESVDVGHELFTIADPAVVWAQLQVFPGDLARVRVGAPVEVLPPDATSGARGEISFITPVLDHATRTATARVVLENDGTYQPGLFVTGRVAVEREDVAVSIPTSALVRDGSGWVVFARAGPDRFARRPVTVSRRGIERSAIEAGLEAGEEVVTDGAFLVKSAAARDALGGGHGH